MHAGHIPGATRILGKAQGYVELPVRDTVMIEDNSHYPMMTTAWIPDDDDITNVNKGASIYVALMGESHPPMRVTIGKPPDKYPVRLNTTADLMRCGLSLKEAQIIAAKLLLHGLRLTPLIVQK